MDFLEQVASGSRTRRRLGRSCDAQHDEKHSDENSNCVLRCTPRQFTTRGYSKPCRMVRTPRVRVSSFSRPISKNNAVRSMVRQIQIGLPNHFTARTVSSRLPLIVHDFERKEKTHDLLARNSICPTRSSLKKIPYQRPYGHCLEMRRPVCEPDVSHSKSIRRAGTFDLAFAETKQQSGWPNANLLSRNTWHFFGPFRNRQT